MAKNLLSNLFWVDAMDSERPTDPLGLTATANELAGRILPGISVATGRARYLSFYCWAWSAATGSEREKIRKIHEWEFKIAQLHAKKETDDEHQKLARRGIFGISGQKQKTPGWHTYKPRLEDLGFFENSKLTQTGEELAKAYGGPGNPEAKEWRADWRMDAIKRGEREILRNAMGLGGKKESDPQKIRSGVSKLKSKLLIELLGGAKKVDNPDWEVALFEAHAWEYFSLGADVIFMAWLGSLDGQTIWRKNKPRESKKASLTLGKADLSGAIANIAKARKMMSSNLEYMKGLDAAILDRAWCDLPDAFYACHMACKRDGQWVVKNGQTYALTATGKAQVQAGKYKGPKLHPYRFAAFKSLLHDLGEKTTWENQGEEIQ